MGWFSEQLNKRRKTDEDRLSDSLYNLASSIMQDKCIRAAGDDGFADDAVQEIVRYFGYKPVLNDIPGEITDKEEQLDYLLRPYGIMRRNVLLDKGWHRHATGPMIGTLKGNDSMAAIIPTGLSGYDLIDYANGRRFRIDRKNEDILSNNAICFYKPLPMRSISLNDVMTYIKEQLSGADLFFYIIAMAVPVLIGFLVPAFTKWLFDRVIPSGSTELLFSLALFMLGFLLCQLFLNMFRTVVKNRTNTKIDVSLRAALMGRLLSLNSGLFVQYSSGELATRIIQMEDICTIIIETLGSAGITAVLSLIYVIEAYVFAPDLAGTALVISLLDIAVISAAIVLKSRNTGQYLYQSTKTGGMTYPMITGIEKIKISGAESRMFSRWADQYSKETAVRYNPSWFLKIWPALFIAVNNIGALLVFFKAYNNHTSPADYYAFTSAFGLISASFTMLAQMVVLSANIKPAFELLKPILEAEPETDSNKSTVVSLTGNIEFRDVSFGYEKGMPNVIDSLSFNVSPGEYVGIVGKTGCGKSTLLRLMLGFETPRKGSIYFDKRDISKLDKKSLRRKIGSVFQDEKLFAGDIYSNITIAAPQIPLDQVWEAVEIADIAEDIRNMPMGMHTHISEGNGGLSGGQKQRLMIARAVVMKPSVLLFDEATSALDNITQKKISQAIDKMNCTRIVVAHRLSTVQNCDRILVMDKGRIAEEGKYDELLEKGGLFAELVKRQRIDIDD
ncbi:MAG: ATP-binding cassette domain-containing protein [Lachnospiraceae bacterium]|nr:ATP-binding cassette domain-containing protein [Lachnospiraceae bacterium]